MKVLSDKISALMAKEGIPAWGWVDLDLALAERGPQSYQAHLVHLKRWLQNKQQGPCGYVGKGLAERENPRLVAPLAETVLTVLVPYASKGIGVPERGLRFARYLRGPDYHRELHERLTRVLEQVPGLTFRTFVDTSRVLERAWATLCGLGWIGKNGLLIHPRLGSFCFIGGAFLDKKVHQAPRRMKSYCGQCKACLTGCPTSAFAKPRVLEARRCIAALTLEHRGAWPEDLKELDTSNWVAGCDVCQEVCPFNRKAMKVAEDLKDPFPLDGETYLMESSEAFRERVKKSALSRIKQEDFLRNVRKALT